ncbi:MAG: phospholipase D family protein [Pyrobaculum sp.]
MPRRQIDRWNILNQLISVSSKYGISPSLINELQSKIQIFSQQVSQCQNINLLRKSLKEVPQKYSKSLQIILITAKMKDTYSSLKNIIDEIDKIGSRALYDKHLENKLRENLMNLCQIIKNAINTLSKSKLFEQEIIADIDKELSENIWIRECLSGNLVNLIDTYVNCTNRYALALIPHGDNILDFVQNITGIPTNIIQHKPVKYVKLEFVDASGNVIKDETIETIDLLYSLIPFTLYSLESNKYFIFIPSQKNIVEKKELPGLKVIVPLKIRLREVAARNISLLREKHKEKSKVFEINNNAISQSPLFYVCKLGFVPVMMSNKCENKLCPARNKCYDAKHNNFKFITKIDNSYLRVYNINANIKKDVIFYNSQPIGLAVSVGAIPFLRVNIEEASVVLSIDSIVFTPRESYRWMFYRDPELKVRINGYKLGLDLYNTKSLVLRFDKEFLKNVITNVLKNDVSTRNYICIKYEASKSGEQYIYNKMMSAVSTFLNSGGKCNLSDDLINYAVDVFAHTLAHMLLTYTAAKLQVEYYRTLDYYYEVSDREVIVAIYELGDGGLGLLDRNTLSQVFTDILSDITNYSCLANDGCEKRVGNQISFGNRYVPQLFGQPLIDIWNKYVRDTHRRYRIVINAQTLRAHIYEQVSGNFDEAHEFMQFIPTCMDGCNYCVMLEKGCSTPLEQLIKISRSLLCRVLKELKSEYDRAIQQINDILKKPSKEREDLFLKLLNESTNIKIMTYVIDNYFANKLIERIKSGANVNIQIILNKEKSQEQKDLIRHLMDNGVQVRVLEHLHAKVYLFDDVLVIEGSANLTKKGLVENEETLELKSDLKSVKEYIDRFNETWTKSLEIN